MSTVGKIIWLLVLAAFAVGIHAGFMFGKPYLDYRFFAGASKDLMRFEFKSEEDMKERIIKLASDNNIIIEYDEDGEKDNGLEIWPSSKRRYDIIIKWTKKVDYFGLYDKTFKYRLEYTI
ncbi:MAG: hypothetical protein KAR83_09515 [Thermodesulfovibrionales bacterium]|nr:hypothetical protein [Thermodesulfovibrionales bacterium]